MFATGAKGSNHMRPETNNAYKIANKPAKTATSAPSELLHFVRSEITRKTVDG
jgi:hypothetical protein